jgi:hypothetical protein
MLGGFGSGSGNGIGNGIGLENASSRTGIGSFNPTFAFLSLELILPQKQKLASAYVYPLSLHKIISDKERQYLFQESP